MRHIIRGHMKRNIGLNYLPGHKNFYEFTKSYKTISQKAEASDQCKNDCNIMRGSYTFSFKAKPCSQPFCACIRIRTAKPFCQEHHIKNLVKYRPEPWNPDTFETIYKAQRNHPHSATNIKHVGCIA